jgi:GT2 family glycosyltransferase
MAYTAHQPVVVIPNLNGGDELLAAVHSLVAQTVTPYIIIVDNASTDGSIESALQAFPDIEIIRNSKNYGFTGGVNPGIERAIALGATYVAPFNDDAAADTHWLEQLVACLRDNPKIGAAACKVVTSDKERLDSTGDYYTSWGLPYPRGRREYNLAKYDMEVDIFAASGAASLYRVKALQEVGVFDQAFFAYYEDVDLSFRLQLAGWKVKFVPEAIVYHHIGLTSGRIKGFTTYQTLKNLPILWVKNVPQSYFWHVGRRLALAQLLFFGRAITRGQAWPALKGLCKGIVLICTKFPERRSIQQHKKASDDYIWNTIVHDLPPNAAALRRLRSLWWKLRKREERP